MASNKPCIQSQVTNLAQRQVKSRTTASQILHSSQVNGFKSRTMASQISHDLARYQRPFAWPSSHYTCCNRRLRRQPQQGNEAQKVSLFSQLDGEVRSRDLSPKVQREVRKKSTDDGRSILTYQVKIGSLSDLSSHRLLGWFHSQWIRPVLYVTLCI